MIHPFRIGILGSGRMGRALGRLWSMAGNIVGYAYSRDPARLAAFAREDGGPAWSGTVGEVAKRSDVLLLAVPWARVHDVIAEAGDVRGKTVVGCCLPMTEDDSALAVGLTASGAEILAGRLPGARFVSGFNTLPAELLAAMALRRLPVPPQVVLCGDSSEAKVTASLLAISAGLQPLDAGPLTSARYIEPFALLVAQLAYAPDADPCLGYRFDVLGVT